MENKVLTQNIEQIKHYDYELFNKILMFDNEKSNIQLAQNENGEYNLIFNDVILHSTKSAIEEAKNISKNFIDNKNTIKIIYGLGLGYLIDEASNKITEGKIIIYEPNLEIIKYSLSIATLEALNKENVVLCTNKNELEKHLINFLNENSILSISFLDSYKIYLENIKDVLNFAQTTQGELIGNKNTIIKKAFSMLRHTLYNLRNIYKNPDIHQLKDIYKKKCAIILCAGPSLEKNIEIIKQNQDKFVIFALNPTLKLLAKHNITPDFVVALENSNILAQFNEIDMSKSYFITEAYSYFLVSSLKTKKTFNYIANDDFFNYWVRDCFDIKGEVKNAGTVSYSAFMSAILMGFEKIILVGQDLAYKDGQCYSKDCQWGEMICVFDKEEKKYNIIPENEEKLIEAFKTGKLNKEQAKFIYENHLKYLNQNLCTIKSQDGKDIPSKTDYVVFIKIFEKEATKLKQENNNLVLINSSNGAQIDGFENIPLEKVIKDLEPIEKLNLDNYLPKRNKEYAISKIDKLLEQLIEYRNVINDFNLINEKLLKELTNKKVFTQNAVKYMKIHRDILLEMFKFKNKEGIDFLFNSLFFAQEKFFKVNYFENEKIALETIDAMDKYYKKLYSGLANEVKNLSNSKALILK